MPKKLEIVQKVVIFLQKKSPNRLEKNSKFVLQTPTHPHHTFLGFSPDSPAFVSYFGKLRFLSALLVYVSNGWSYQLLSVLSAHVSFC